MRNRLTDFEARHSRATPKACLVLLAIVCLFLPSCAMSPDLAPASGISPELLAPIEKIAETAIHEGKTPGAVILIGNNDKIVYRHAFGNRSLDPRPVPMTVDTIFDLASLTKVVATTTAVMQLVEEKRISLNDPVVKYWPSFGKNGKSRITIRQLLTHYSGLQPDLDTYPRWSGYAAALKKIIQEKPEASPGSSFIYSDINFEVLGELVKRVSGLPIDLYCSKYIFKPLGMKDTAFRPSPKRRARIAPTDHRNGRLICGVVQDPSCYLMGGISGHAGLFSTADDLALFAEMLLNRGKLGRVRILKPETVDMITTPQSPAGKKRLHGLGWDLEWSDKEGSKPVLPAGSYGHLGYTGTSLWIDPADKTYIIILTNRLNSKGGGDVKALRSEIKQVVASALGFPASPQQHPLEPRRISVLPQTKKTSFIPLKTGIDVLSATDFSALSGLRVGLITNNTGRDFKGERTIDLLKNAPGVKLKAIFSPEHGLSGTLDEAIPSSVDSKTGLPVYSLYGKRNKPTAEMLAGIDALVFDIQDAGVRFYTYISTMGYAMEAASKKGIAFYVLDRPNPITASAVQGPVPDEQKRTFTSYYPLPVRHGMTVGELAQMFNDEYKIGAHLIIIKMQGYVRTAWYDQTGLAWRNPSPNLRNLAETTLYPGVALVEGANVSVGRGTTTPFEILGSPWINAYQLSTFLNNRDISGIKFAAVDFTPVASTYKNRLCHGVRITVVDRNTLDTPLLGIEIINALQRLYPHTFKIDNTKGLVGSRSILTAIKNGQDPKMIAISWRQSLAQFFNLRKNYLIYP